MISLDDFAVIPNELRLYGVSDTMLSFLNILTWSNVIIGDGDNFINNAVTFAKDRGRGRIILLIFNVFKIN